MTGQVMTVLGPVPAEELGVTSMHEHILCDIFRAGGGLANILDDMNAAIQEVSHFRRAGGGAIVEVTCLGLGRDLAGLARVSEATGVHIIAGSGFYVDATLPPVVAERNSARLADYLVEDVDRPAPAPGIIGETGSGRYGATPAEERSLRAAARAALRTGRAVTTHAALGEHGMEQIDILTEEGLPAERIVVGHCDSFWHVDMEQDLRYMEAVIARGACVGFDTVGWNEFMPEAFRVARLAALVERGHADHIVLGSDTCRRTHYHILGGRGYDAWLTEFVPRLREAGVPDSAVDTMLIANPMRILTLAPARPS
jgi:phosphotriesterase-related protein